MIQFFGHFITSCSPNLNFINDEFPEAKAEVMKTLGEITQSIKEWDMDKLISFNAYNSKLNEFNNEAHEGKVFGSITEVAKFNAKDLQIAVYGDVANLTFHYEFQLKFI